MSSRNPFTFGDVPSMAKPVNPSGIVLALPGFSSRPAPDHVVIDLVELTATAQAVLDACLAGLPLADIRMGISVQLALRTARDNRSSFPLQDDPYAASGE